MNKEPAYIGIDPGKTGAAALITQTHDGKPYLDIVDFEDAVQVASIIREWADDYDIRMVILERVHSMPKQGVSSTFAFGENFGVWQGILATLGVPHKLVRPQQWQSGLFSKADGDKKKRSLAVVRRLYPASNYFRRAKDHNRAEAALMAKYASEAA